jgi:hypothetical protein
VRTPIAHRLLQDVAAKAVLRALAHGALQRHDVDALDRRDLVWNF